MSATASAPANPLRSNGDSATANYRVKIDPELRRLDIEARFTDPVGRLAARSHDATLFLIGAMDCETRTPIRVRGQRIRPPRQDTRCIRYSVDLKAAARAERRNAGLSAANVIVSPAAWLWRPTADRNQTIILRFDPGPGIDVFVPWSPVDGDDGAYRVEQSPESARAPSVFGSFEYRETVISGATLRITLLDAERWPDPDAAIDWVRSAASNINLAYGYFPNPSPSVVLLPVSADRDDTSAVPFGRVIRDGGETIELLVNPQRPMAEFYDDWTATHEFSHLMLPYLDAGHRWISEGFAQYYQNLLLARAGRYSEQRAWQELRDGFGRGRASRPDLSPNAASRRGNAGALMKRYWSGAAIALLADVELRRRTDGRQSLDDVLRELQRCCLPAGSRWRGPELLERLDSFVDAPLFVPLYRQYADRPGFPDVGELLEALGVRTDGANGLNDDAPLAELRRAMTER